MDSFFTGTSILYFSGCLALGVLYAWLLYRGEKNLSPKIMASLAILRALAVSILAWLLFAPLVKTLNYTLDKPIIIIGQDNSLSIGQIKPRGFDQKLYEEHLKTLQKKLSDEYEVKSYSFSDQVTDGLSFTNQGKQTDITAFLQKITDTYTNRNIGAIILSTDGIFNRGGNPLYTSNQLHVPVYTIALGDSTAKKDVLISNINYNNIVYLDDDFTIEIQVQAYQSNGEHTNLSVSQGGVKIANQDVAIQGNAFVKNISLKLHAGKVGVQKYTVKLSPLKNEITDKNNEQTFYVEVIDGRQKVLLASVSPHPDLSVLKEAIQSNKHYEVKLLLGDELNSIDPSKFDVIILYQLPDAQNISAPFLSKCSLVKKPTWYILGAQSQLNIFNQVQNQVNIGSANGSVQEVYPELSSRFMGFNITDEEKRQILTYDPLLSPFGRLNVNTNVTPVLNQRIGKVSTQSPLLFFSNENGLKTAYLMGEGLWRWKLSEAENQIAGSAVNNLISRTVQYLSVKDDRRKFKVFTSKSDYGEGESIQFNGSLYNDNYQPINDPEVNLQIKNEAGKIFNYVFSKTSNAYELDAGSMEAGNYTYIANTIFDGHKLTATGSFYVNSLISEYQHTTADHQLLNTISKQSNGKMFQPQHLLEIINEIKKNENIKTISYEDRQYNELISLKWLFAVILLLLCTEWLVRKRNGSL